MGAKSYTFPALFQMIQTGIECFALLSFRVHLLQFSFSLYLIDSQSDFKSQLKTSLFSCALYPAISLSCYYFLFNSNVFSIGTLELLCSIKWHSAVILICIRPSSSRKHFPPRMLIDLNYPHACQSCHLKCTFQLLL